MKKINKIATKLESRTKKLAIEAVHNAALMVKAASENDYLLADFYKHQAVTCGAKAAVTKNIVDYLHQRFS